MEKILQRLGDYGPLYADFFVAMVSGICPEAVNDILERVLSKVD